MDFHIIITAQDVSVKIVNQLLLNVRNWEYGDDPTWDEYQIYRNMQELTEGKGIEGIPPIQEFTNNEFEGMTFQDLEAQMLEKEQRLFLVLDDEGVQNKTAILVNRAVDYEGDTLYFDEYNKMRIEWQEVTSIYVNLSISNMGFEEFTKENDTEVVGDEEAHRARGRWWTFKQVAPPFPDDCAVTRNAAIMELEKLDLA